MMPSTHLTETWEYVQQADLEILERLFGDGTDSSDSSYGRDFDFNFWITEDFIPYRVSICNKNGAVTADITHFLTAAIITYKHSNYSNMQFEYCDPEYFAKVEACLRKLST